jgi:hypothetical protein
MGIFVSSQADLIAMINIASGVTFTASDLVFGTPRAATSAEITQYGKNTAIPVRGSDTSTLVSGSTLFFYDRLNLQPLEKFDLTTCYCSDGLAMAAWVPIVTNYLNVPLTVGNLVEHASSTVNGKVTVQLEATAASLGWFGTATLKFGGYPDIATAFSDNKLTGF